MLLKVTISSSDVKGSRTGDLVMVTIFISNLMVTFNDVNPILYIRWINLSPKIVKKSHFQNTFIQNGIFKTFHSDENFLGNVTFSLILWTDLSNVCRLRLMIPINLFNFK